MTPKQFWSQHSQETVKSVAEAAGTNLANFKHIALYSGACSADLARRLSKASGGEMGLEEILFRDEDESAA